MLCHKFTFDQKIMIMMSPCFVALVPSFANQRLVALFAEMCNELCSIILSEKGINSGAES